MNLLVNELWSLKSCYSLNVQVTESFKKHKWLMRRKSLVINLLHHMIFSRLILYILKTFRIYHAFQSIFSISKLFLLAFSISFKLFMHVAVIDTFSTPNNRRHASTTICHSRPPVATVTGV